MYWWILWKGGRWLSCLKKVLNKKKVLFLVECEICFTKACEASKSASLFRENNQRIIRVHVLVSQLAQHRKTHLKFFGQLRFFWHTSAKRERSSSLICFFPYYRHPRFLSELLLTELRQLKCKQIRERAGWLFAVLVRQVGLPGSWLCRSQLVT